MKSLDVFVLISVTACSADDGVKPVGQVSGPGTTPGVLFAPDSTSTTEAAAGATLPTSTANPTPPTPGTTPGVVPAAPTGTGECSNADSSLLPIDATGWVSRDCNDYYIQGAWYCYDDGVNPSGCTVDVPPYRDGAGMCLQGNTSVDSSYQAWGAGIGLGLNDSGAQQGSVKSAYNAAANGFNAFHVEMTGDSGGLPIRINFTNTADTTDSVAPFWQVPGVGTYDIRIADALVPEDWGIPESGTVANPEGIYDVQVQIVGGELAGSYDFCVTALYPVMAP